MLVTKTAIVIGATGLTGRILLSLLLEDEGFDKVIVFGRRSVDVKNPKLEEYIVDLFDVNSFKDLFKADVVFCCIGTTKAKTPDKEIYEKIDYGIPLEAAKLALNNNIQSFLVVSSMGANAKSSIFYNRLKGRMESDIRKLGIKNTYFFRPSLIVGDRNEKRGFENFGKWMFSFFDFIIPSKFKMVKAEKLAKSMLRISKTGYSSDIVPNTEILS